MAALVGAGVGRFARGDTLARIAGPLAIAAGVLTEYMVLDDHPGTLSGVPVLLVLGGLGAAAVLGLAFNARVRSAAIAVALASLLVAPAAWSVETLGHATNGTFPAGGPADGGVGFGGGGPGGFRGGRFGGRPPTNAAPGGPGGVGGPGGGGGPFGGQHRVADDGA